VVAQAELGLARAGFMVPPAASEAALAEIDVAEGSFRFALIGKLVLVSCATTTHFITSCACSSTTACNIENKDATKNKWDELQTSRDRIVGNAPIA
jgi:hypothetical protein